MKLATLFFKQRRAPTKYQAEPLETSQIRWLGALLLASQLAIAFYVPFWIACLGTVLVGIRFLLISSAAKNPSAPAQVIRSWVLGLLALVTAVAIWQTLGYFVGRDPCVAFLFALIGIKFLETRTARDGTLIVCLACLLIVTPFLYSQSLLAAAAAIPSLALLGGTMQVLSRPGTLAPIPGGWRVPLLGTLRMLFQGIPLALVLFLLFPRISAPLWGVPGDHAGRTGLSEHLTMGAISELSLSDAVAFRVDFDSEVPPPWLRYWRGPVMSTFDGREWGLAPQRPATAFARPEGRPIIYTITLEPTWKPWLFALDIPSTLPQSSMDSASSGLHTDLDAMLTRDQQLIARAPITQPLRYQQTSVIRDSYPAARGPELEREIEENLYLPPPEERSNLKTIAFAKEMRSKYSDDRRFIAAALDWFTRENFYYTLSPPLLGNNPVDGFLFDTRRGFCEHYASAFVVMLRAAGIPARIVTGYQGGTMNPNGNYMIVRQSDAHAWAEAYVGGQWRRYDPTAAVAPSRIQLGLGGSLPEGERIPMLARLDDSVLKSIQLAWDALNHDWRRNIVGFNFDKQRMLWREWKLNTLAPWQIAAIFVTIGAAWIGTLFLWLAWRRRRQDRARAVWDAMCARLARAGLPRDPHEGPLAYVARAAKRWPKFTTTFGVIGDSYATLRYGPVATHPDTHLERASALWRLKHAVRLLPAPSALRTLPSTS